MCATHLQQRCVYVALTSLLDWEPVERLKQRSHMVSFTCAFLVPSEHPCEHR